MGVCIFGQGDCSDKTNIISKTLNRSLNENIKNTMVSIKDTTGAQLSGSQVIDIGSIKLKACRLEISGISQKMIAKYSFTQMSSRVSETQFKNQMKASVQRSVDANQDVKRALMGGAGGDVTVQNETLNENINRISTSFSYNDFKALTLEMDNKQLLGLKNVEIDCTGMPPEYAVFNLNNINQDILMDVMVKKMSSDITKEATAILNEMEERSETSVIQKTEATSIGAEIGTAAGGIGAGIGAAASGVGSGLGMAFAIPIMIIVGLILFVVLIGVIIKSMGGSSSPAVPPGYPRPGYPGAPPPGYPGAPPPGYNPTTGRGELIEVGEM